MFQIPIAHQVDMWDWLKIQLLEYNKQWIVCSSNADHPWLQNAKKAPNVSLGETVRSRLKQFSVMNKLKKNALRVMTQTFQLKKTLSCFMISVRC